MSPEFLVVQSQCPSSFACIAQNVTIQSCVSCSVVAADLHVCVRLVFFRVVLE